MTRQQIIELIQHKLCGGNMTPDLLGKYHPEVIAKWVDAVLADYFFAIFRQNPDNFDTYAKPFKNVPVLFDEDTDTWYSLLPSPVLQFTQTQEGVRDIRTMKGKGIEFEPIMFGSAEVFNDLDAGKIDSVIGYITFQDRVTYDRNPETDKVLMMLVIPFSEYGDNDKILLPSGVNIKILTDAVQAFATGLGQEKQVNDNTSKQVK